MVLEPVLCVFRKRMCFSGEHSLGVEVNPGESNSVLALLLCNLLQIKNARFSQFLENFPLSHMLFFLLQNLSGFYLVYYLFGLFSGEHSRENNSLFASPPSYPLGIKKKNQIQFSCIYLNTHELLYFASLFSWF